MKEKSQEDEEIDNITKYTRRPRSPAPNSHEGSKSAQRHGTVGLLDTHLTISNGKLGGQNEYTQGPVNRFSKVEDECFLLKASDIAVKQVEFVLSDILPGSHERCKPKHDTPTAVESTSQKLQDLKHSSVCTTPEIVMCSKAANHMSKAANVCYAATKLRGHQKSCKRLVGSEYFASPSNKKARGGSSNSNRREGDSVDRKMLQKNPKSKINCDEANHRPSSAGADRRLRIMRYLGLAPPIGSPY